MTLHIPEIPGDATNLEAALLYAQAGFYVLPVDPNVGSGKSPGSVVGNGWPAMSSTDPKTIAAWFAGTDHGIALHAGRSGAVIVDVDDYDNLPDEIVAATETTDCPYQSTRPGQPGRGHYIFANTTGRRIGNGLGKLATEKKWGEIRGANGVIVVAPSAHPDGGLYQWQRTGAVPPIPDYLANALPDSTNPEATATDAEIDRFLNTHTEATKPEALAGLVTALTNKLAAGHSCHMSTLGVLTDAMSEAAAGYYDARTATRELWPPYLHTVTRGTSTGRILDHREATQQYKGIVAWAIGQAAPNTDKARQRVAEKYRDADTIEIHPEDIPVPPPAPAAAKVTPEPTPPAPAPAPAEAPKPEPEPAEAAPTTVDTTATLEDIEENFWTARPSLTLIYDAALSQMCSPWAVLACCAARTLAMVPPHVILPDIIGGHGSLNWFAAIVAKSGGGKGAANAVATKLTPGDVLTRGAGSGEGMIEAYNRSADPEDHITSVLFSVDEVDSIASMQARAGQTTMAVIRSGFSGENLGYSYRGRAKEKVEAHTYRMTMIVSVQPERAGGLFSDSAGGTPQRFMWFPGRDRRIKVDRPAWPTTGGARQSLPTIDPRKLPPTGITIPPEAELIILKARETANGSGDDDALDGHALYCREKFAYALALFDGRAHIDSDDWKLSGIVADVSDWCRMRAQNVLAKAETAQAAERGRLRGIESYEADISRAVVSNTNLKRILTWAVGKLAAAEGRRMTKRDLSRATNGRDRAKLTEAMLRGVEAGLIVAEGTEWVLL
jgi:hypothetical protein